MGAAIANVSGRVLTPEVGGLLTQPGFERMQVAAAAIFGGDDEWRIQGITHVSDAVFRAGATGGCVRPARP